MDVYTCDPASNMKFSTFASTVKKFVEKSANLLLKKASIADWSACSESRCLEMRFLIVMQDDYFIHGLIRCRNIPQHHSF